MTNTSYQRCVDKIVIEPNMWFKSGEKYAYQNKEQVSIYFKWNVFKKQFRYCPRFSEIRAIIDLMVELYGIGAVNEELGVYKLSPNEGEDKDKKPQNESN